MVVPEVPLKSLKGALKGMSVTDLREKKGPGVKVLRDSSGWIECFIAGPPRIRIAGSISFPSCLAITFLVLSTAKE